MRFSAKGMKSHRAKLGISAGDYGRLAGVSAQSIYNYETGKATPRQAQVAALLAVRSLGKREAMARLESM
jgi:predicted transcriptional regulator